MIRKRTKKPKYKNLRMLVDCKELDAAMEKAERLNALLEEANRLKKEISRIKVRIDFE